MTITIGFTGSPLVRLERERHDPAAIARLTNSADALLLDLADHYSPVRAGDTLGWQPIGDTPHDELLMLGTIDGIARFAHLDPAAPPARRTPELFAILASLAPAEAATYATARSLLDWHARHRFCANCGNKTDPHRGGWIRRCPNCATEHFPRTDPVVIMLAEHGEGAAARVLIGRQPGFPAGRYSALAGFVEVGESIEEAVARELDEEAGLAAHDIRYIASQPWPFPSQLMIACIARVADDVVTLDMEELEDAMWVTRDEIALALAGDPAARFVPPPPYAIAHSLLRAWLDAPPD